jgi:hypothetical protein
VAKQATSTPNTAARPSDDGLNLAAIHWMAMEIEQVATELYVTSPEAFGSILDSLRDQVDRLKGMKPRTFSGDDCPDGWMECDGLCVPMCTNLAAASRSRTSK